MHDLEIIKLGNPSLRLISKKIENFEFGTKDIVQLEENLFKVMEMEKGIGLAAPQIGCNKRVIVFGMKKHAHYSESDKIPYTALFNPSYYPLTSDKEEAYEGCLSVRGIRAKVSRYKKIYYSGFSSAGDLIEEEASDLHARVIQHEIDHLNGIVFLDKVTNFNSLGFTEELIRAGIIKINNIE